MAIAVVYFTRTGNAERIAEKINESVKGDLIKLKDKQKWRGFFGYMNGGRHAIKQKIVDTYTEPDVDLATYDSIILITPMWAGNLPPATYSYLKQHPKITKKTRLVVQSAGTDATTYREKFEGYVGKFNKIYSISRSQKEEVTIIEQIISDIK
jgi:flavodoxin